MGDNKLSYTDKEGNKLYGFSQTSLDRNTAWLKRLVIIGGTFLGLILAYVLWLTFYVIRNNVVNNIVNSCV